ncbi:LLM class flavin-dependent oxidoreductase [Sorangium sp. So ce861]
MAATTLRLGAFMRPVSIHTGAWRYAALNFGLTEHVEHDERYRRAREFYDVVTGLWDSFADDAFVRDVEAGIYFDPERLHVLDHKGEYYSARGPLNIARPVQGWPVIVQAGASEAGRQLAAETAEVVFAAQSTLEGARRFYADVKGRRERLGRDPGLVPARVRREHAAREPGARASRESFLSRARRAALSAIGAPVRIDDHPPGRRARGTDVTNHGHVEDPGRANRSLHLPARRR